MRNTDKSANLDVLRAYAVLAVYFGHLLRIFHWERLGSVTIYDLAQTGVLIFFVHTSLVLMLSLERIGLEGWGLFQVFYIRRAFRIYPLSIFTVLAMLIARAPGFPTEAYGWPGWHTVLSNLALMQNLTRSESYPVVLWSLPYEIQMYIVFPVMFLLLRRFTSWWIPMFLWFCDAAALVLLFQFKITRLASFLQYTPCFLGGMIGYRLWSAARRDAHFWKWPVAITSAVAFRVIAEASGIRGAAILSSWLVCLFLGVAVPQFCELGRGWIRISASMIAKYSYGIYLSHSAVFWMAFVLLRNTPLWSQAGACVALSALLPIAVYHGIEKPMIDFGINVAAASAEQKEVAAIPKPQR